MKIEFLASAEAEFEGAIAYYKMQSEGLDFEFAAEVKKTLERIVQYPKAWPSLSERTRRCRTNRFPYGVIYQIREKSILIIALMHLSRASETWQSRLKNMSI